MPLAVLVRILRWHLDLAHRRYVEGCDTEALYHRSLAEDLHRQVERRAAA